MSYLTTNNPQNICEWVTYNSISNFFGDSLADVQWLLYLQDTLFWGDNDPICPQTSSCAICFCSVHTHDVYR